MAGELIYVPAEMPGGPSTASKEAILNDEAISVRWWLPKESLFYYPKVLISAYYGVNYPKLRELFGFPKEGMFMGDSGGFQVLQGWLKKKTSLELNVPNIIKWYEANCDIGLAPDIPPYTSDFNVFKKIADRSAVYFQKMADLKERKDLRLLKVVHSYGFNTDFMDYWYDKVKDIPEYDGWSVGVKPMATPMLIAFQMMYLYSKGHRKNFHILGTSGIKNVALMGYLSRHINPITFDSSSWSDGSQRRKYFNPIKYNSTAIYFGESFNSTIEKLPCDCPVCTKVGDNWRIFNTIGSPPGGLLSLHNLWLILRHVKIMDRLKDDEVVYKEFVRTEYGSEVATAIDFIDCCIERGFDVARVKFSSHLNIKQRNIEQPSLLTF